MADDENKIKKWIKKWQKDKGDIGAEENPQITGPAENLREAEKNLREAEKNFREEATKVDED